MKASHSFRQVKLSYITIQYLFVGSFVRMITYCTCNLILDIFSYIVYKFISFQQCNLCCRIWSDILLVAIMYTVGVLFRTMLLAGKNNRYVWNSKHLSRQPGVCFLVVFLFAFGKPKLLSCKPPYGTQDFKQNGTVPFQLQIRWYSNSEVCWTHQQLINRIGVGRIGAPGSPWVTVPCSCQSRFGAGQQSNNSAVCELVTVRFGSTFDGYSE